MDRRDFLKTGGAVAASVAAGARPASAVETPQPTSPAVHLGATRLVLATGQDADAPGFAARRLTQRIEAVSGGRFTFEMRPRSAGDSEADLTFGSAHEHARHHPAFAFFAGLPRGEGLDPGRQSAWLAVGGGQMLWDEAGAEFGFKPLLAGHTGPSAGLWSSRRLDAISDLTGARVFAVGLAVDVLRVLGAGPVELAPQELGAALAGGHVEAAERLGPLAALDLQPPAERLYTPGLTPAGMALALTVRRDLWESMGAAEQSLLEVCATAEYHAALAEARAFAMVEARVATSVSRLSFHPRFAAALDRAAADVVERAADTDPTSRRIADSHRAFRELMGAVPTPTA